MIDYEVIIQTSILSTFSLDTGKQRLDFASEQKEIGFVNFMTETCMPLKEKLILDPFSSR